MPGVTLCETSAIGCDRDQSHRRAFLSIAFCGPAEKYKQHDEQFTFGV
jgi:hypothetical protein